MFFKFICLLLFFFILFCHETKFFSSVYWVKISEYNILIYNFGRMILGMTSKSGGGIIITLSAEAQRFSSPGLK